MLRSMTPSARFRTLAIVASLAIFATLALPLLTCVASAAHCCCTDAELGTSTCDSRVSEAPNCCDLRPAAPAPASESSASSLSPSPLAPPWGARDVTDSELSTLGPSSRLEPIGPSPGVPIYRAHRTLLI